MGGPPNYGSTGDLTIDSRVEVPSITLDFSHLTLQYFLTMPRCNTTAPVQIISLKWNFEKLLLVTCSPTKACFAVLHVKRLDFSRLTLLTALVFSFVQSNNT